MTPKRQHGMTMWSAAFVIAVVVFFLFLFFKLLPPYLEDLKIKTALDGLASDPGAGTMTKAELVSRLAKRFDIDSVTNVQARQLGIDVHGNSKTLRMNYEIVVPLAYNVSALLEFNHERQVTGAQ